MEPVDQSRMRAIEAYAEEFRRLAVDLHWILPFPHGACAESSEILGALLETHGFGTWELISRDTKRNDPEDWTSHAWLQQFGVIVDPTFDQFSAEKPWFDPEATLVSFDESRLIERFPEKETRRNVESENLWLDYRIKFDYLLPRLAHLAFQSN